MHASSLENMEKCYRRYIAGGPLEARAETIVLDVGGADVNGTYRDLFAKPPFRYQAADLGPGPSVDIVLDDPYRFPLPDGSVDIVISGQALEHAEFFWRMFEEMVRVLRPEGFIFLIAPSAGPIHRFPVDCYRFYPDSYAALAKHAGCVLVQSWLDERGPWRDLVGVFRRIDAPPLTTVVSDVASALPMSASCPRKDAGGTEEEERVRGAVSYLEILDRLHRELVPAHYLEIGVRLGTSLALARGPATGVDPMPALDRELPATSRIVPLTSDEFFAENTGVTPDLCLIDGMHLLEYALRDFMNIERCAAPGAVVVIDDIFPNHPAQADRVRRTRAWTGDVWRLVEVLRRHRPDLFLLPIDVGPAGLLLVAGLDPANRVLWDNYNPIVSAARKREGPPQSVLERQGAFHPQGMMVRRLIEAMKIARAESCPPQEMVARLRGVRDRVAAAALGPAAPKPQTRPDLAAKPVDLELSAPGLTVPKLSVVVIGYNMARELPRTILSLSPKMQRDIDPQDYEVILIDNGSTRPFDEGVLRNILPSLVLHRFENATVSPVPAINYGLSLARGDLVGVCIDGARMASPGLLAKALAASRLADRPVVGTIAFHLGPKTQRESVKEGYNQEVEDDLLARSGWENDGYQLFKISALAGSSSKGWFHMPKETNALFLRAGHWRALGGWDERFVTPGGGYVNLDTWARACADPEAEVIMLLGEGTFHQIHGDNRSASVEAAFYQEYLRIRGKAYARPARQPLFFGGLPETSRRFAL
jgi:SAM-dependent methyltransferase